MFSIIRKDLYYITGSLFYKQHICHAYIEQHLVVGTEKLQKQIKNV